MFLLTIQSAPAYWATFDEFELQFGNADTYREMLRIKRTVETQYAQSNFVAGVMAASKAKTEEKSKDIIVAVKQNTEPVVVAVTAPATGAMALLGQKRRQQELVASSTLAPVWGGFWLLVYVMNMMVWMMVFMKLVIFFITYPFLYIFDCLKILLFSVCW